MTRDQLTSILADIAEEKDAIRREALTDRTKEECERLAYLTCTEDVLVRLRNSFQRPRCPHCNEEL